MVSFCLGSIGCETSRLVSHPYPMRFIRSRNLLDMITTGNDKPIKISDDISKTVSL